MISVVIASMGRHSLLDTLASLAGLRVPEGEELEVIVADDSAELRVEALVARLASPLAIRVLPVGAGNVSHARNACLDAARGQWLAFIDDDETAAPGWLEGLLSAALEFRADAVFGPVYPAYPAGTPAWFRKADPLFQDWKWGENGREIRRGRTGNTLLRRAAVGALRFDPAFGRSGGEDHDFFVRLAEAGSRMVVTDRARVAEIIPPDRVDAGYVLRRATRAGQTYAIARARGAGRLHGVAFCADALAKLVVAGTLAALLRPFDRARAFRLRMRMSANYGKLLGATGAPLRSSWS